MKISRDEIERALGAPRRVEVHARHGGLTLRQLQFAMRSREEGGGYEPVDLEIDEEELLRGLPHGKATLYLRGRYGDDWREGDFVSLDAQTEREEETEGSSEEAPQSPSAELTGEETPSVEPSEQSPAEESEGAAADVSESKA